MQTQPGGSGLLDHEVQSAATTLDPVVDLLGQVPNEEQAEFSLFVVGLEQVADLTIEFEGHLDSTVGLGVLDGQVQTALLLEILVAANLVSISASLIPVMVAARRDPGIVLNEDP